MSLPTSPTLKELRDDVLGRIGDPSATTPADSRVWSDDEMDGYIRDGIREFAIRTHLFWDVAFVDDLPYTGNYTQDFENQYIKAGEVIHNRFSFTSESEAEYQGRTKSPANHTTLFERDTYLIREYISAVERVPEDLYQVERVTWNGRKISPYTSRYLQHQDNVFEQTRGSVFKYLMDKDGGRAIRKWRPPSAKATYYLAVGGFGVLRGSADVVTVAASSTLRVHIDQFGVVVSGVLDAPPSVFGEFSPGGGALSTGSALAVVAAALTALSEFSGYTIVSRYIAGQNAQGGTTTVSGLGILRRLPGYFPSNGPWGLVRSLHKDTSNTSLEFWRRPRLPSSQNEIIDLPLYLIKHIRNYCRYRAYDKSGVGQDLKLAAHFKARFEVGVERTKARVGSILKMKLVRLGGAGEDRMFGSRHYLQIPQHLRSS